MKTQFAAQKMAGSLIVLLLTLLSFDASAQTYSVDWFKASGGGGRSTNGHYSVTGTIGQADAGGPMTAASYSVTGGLWSLINVVQTAGLPTLAIRHSGNRVTVFWPVTGSCTLQQNGNPAMPGGWVASGYAITTADGTNSVTVTSPAGNLFFRLKR